MFLSLGEEKKKKNPLNRPERWGRNDTRAANLLFRISLRVEMENSADKKDDIAWKKNIQRNRQNI